MGIVLVLRRPFAFVEFLDVPSFCMVRAFLNTDSDWPKYLIGNAFLMAFSLIPAIGSPRTLPGTELPLSAKFSQGSSS